MRCPDLDHPVVVAESFLMRLRGWMGLACVPAHLLLIPGCRAVHSCFMRFAIDLIFINADRQIVSLVRGLRPWRFAACGSACAVIEAPAGWIDRRSLRCGDRLHELDLPAWANPQKDLA